LKDGDNRASKILTQYGVTYTIWRHISGANEKKFLGYNFLFVVNALINMIQGFSRKQHNF